MDGGTTADASAPSPATTAASVDPSRRGLARELALAALAICAAIALSLLDFGRVNAIPAGAAAVPAVALALVARPWVVLATGLLCVGSVTALYWANGLGGWSSTGRVAAGLAAVGVSTLLSSLRIARERQVVEHARTAERMRSEAVLGRWLSMALRRSGTGAWEWRVGSRSLRTRGMADLLGLPDESMVTARTWLAMLDDAERAAWTKEVGVSLEHSIPIQQVQQIHTADVEPRWLEVRAEPLVEGDRVVGLVGTAVDITDRVVAERDERERQALTEAVLAAVPFLAAAPDEAALMMDVCRRGATIFGADAVSVWAVEPDGSARLTARFPDRPERLGEQVPLAAILAATRPASVRSHVLRRPQVRPFLSQLPAQAPRLAITTPLRVAGQPYAYLSIAWNEDRPDPSPEWLAVVDRFASRVVLVRAMVVARQAQAESAALSERLQLGLAPTRLDRGHVSGWRVSTVYRPGESRLRLGGDFLDTWPLEDGRIAFVLGDVCGHGPEPAALGVMLRSSWTGALASQTRDPGQWADVLQRVLETRRSDIGTFTTLVTGLLDPVGRTVTLVCAGHPPPVRITGGGAEPLPVRHQPALGILDDVRFHAETVTLDEGDALLVFSDGVFEGRDRRTELGYEGIVAEVARRRPRDEQDLHRLLADVDARLAGTDDDATMILLSPPATCSDALARADQPQAEQDQDRADDRPDDPGGLQRTVGDVPAEQQVAEETADQ